MVSENRTNMTQILVKATDASGSTSGYIWYDVNRENAEKTF
jgi:hypothetical protein